LGEGHVGHGFVEDFARSMGFIQPMRRQKFMPTLADLADPLFPSLYESLQVCAGKIFSIRGCFVQYPF
jgi:hypothetical protein